MSNEAIQVRGTAKTICTSLSGTVATNVLSAVLTNGYTATDTLGKPDAEFAAKLVFGSNPTENSTVDLYVRAKNIQSTNHSEAPTTTYKPRFVCSFVIKGGQTTTYADGVGMGLPKEGDFYFYNNNTGQTLQTTCELYMTPLTLGPAA